MPTIQELEQQLKEAKASFYAQQKHEIKLAEQQAEKLAVFTLRVKEPDTFNNLSHPDILIVDVSKSTPDTGKCPATQCGMTYYYAKSLRKFVGSTGGGTWLLMDDVMNNHDHWTVDRKTDPRLVDLIIEWEHAEWPKKLSSATPAVEHMNRFHHASTETNERNCMTY